jgi:predicted RNase H-like nuclease (RuvC/YqgF family)
MQCSIAANYEQKINRLENRCTELAGICAQSAAKIIALERKSTNLEGICAQSAAKIVELERKINSTGRGSSSIKSSWRRRESLESAAKNLLMRGLLILIMWTYIDVGGTGMHIDEITQGFGADEISTAVAGLTDEGYIYSTIDESHFRYAS